jgi:hypothetical protein
MKKLLFSLPLLTAALLLSSCGGIVKADKQEAKTDGEVLASDTNAIAETESGTVAGYQENGVYIYKGIPYAKAERFMPPQPVAKWEGIRSSRAYGPTCPQGKRAGWYHDESAFAFDWNDGFPDEDCLRVNIWTPGLKDGKKRPVMVWLHGGGYAAGSGQELPSYDGSNLAKNGDVVVVTMDAHQPDDKHFELWPAHNVVGTKGQEPYGELRDWYVENESNRDVLYVPKTNYNAFHETTLAFQLKMKKVEKVHVVGVCTDICDFLTLAGADAHGFKTAVHKRGVATFTNLGETFINQAKMIFHTEIIE